MLALLVLLDGGTRTCLAHHIGCDTSLWCITGFHLQYGAEPLYRFVRVDLCQRSGGGSIPAQRGWRHRSVVRVQFVQEPQVRMGPQRVRVHGGGINACPLAVLLVRRTVERTICFELVTKTTTPPTVGVRIADADATNRPVPRPRPSPRWNSSQSSCRYKRTWREKRIAHDDCPYCSWSGARDDLRWRWILWDPTVGRNKCEEEE